MTAQTLDCLTPDPAKEQYISKYAQCNIWGGEKHN